MHTRVQTARTPSNQRKGTFLRGGFVPRGGALALNSNEVHRHPNQLRHVTTLQRKAVFRLVGMAHRTVSTGWRLVGARGCAVRQRKEWKTRKNFTIQNRKRDFQVSPLLVPYWSPTLSPTVFACFPSEAQFVPCVPYKNTHPADFCTHSTTENTQEMPKFRRKKAARLAMRGGSRLGQVRSMAGCSAG